MLVENLCDSAQQHMWWLKKKIHILSAREKILEFDIFTGAAKVFIIHCCSPSLNSDFSANVSAVEIMIVSVFSPHRPLLQMHLG